MKSTSSKDIGGESSSINKEAFPGRGYDEDRKRTEVTDLKADSRLTETQKDMPNLTVEVKVGGEVLLKFCEWCLTDVKTFSLVSFYAVLLCYYMLYLQKKVTRENIFENAGPTFNARQKIKMILLSESQRFAADKARKRGPKLNS